MKKLLALLLAILMMFSLVACGGDANGDDVDNSSNPSIVTGQDDIDDVDADDVDDVKEPLVLDGNDEYVVAIKKGSGITISHIKDIKGLRVGFAFGNDGEKIAEYYKAVAIGYGGENDAFSDLIGGTALDCVIVKKMAAESYANEGKAEIALDPIVIE